LSGVCWSTADRGSSRGRCAPPCTRRAHLHGPQALELLARDLLGLGREVRLRDALLEAVEVALVALVLAELFLDGLELLAEHVLALVLAHLLLDLGVDALAHLEDLELPREQLEHLADALLHVDRLMSWAFSSTGASRFAATRSASAPGSWMESMSELRLARELGHELDDLLGDVAQAHRQRLGLDVLGWARRACGSSPSCTGGLRDLSRRMRTRP
jgi:hypothetical protein